jgi:hypothetical protein
MGNLLETCRYIIADGGEVLDDCRKPEDRINRQFQKGILLVNRMQTDTAGFLRQLQTAIARQSAWFLRGMRAMRGVPDSLIGK